MPDGPRRGRSPVGARWMAVALALTAPALLTLCAILWYSPYPLSEGVALLEDVADGSSYQFLTLTRTYYRPLFHLSLFAAWHHAGSVEAFLAAVKLFHIVPVAFLVVGLIGGLRPRTPADAAATLVAGAVLIGSPGFLDNLEIPLTYTIVGMACALAVWLIAERPARWWHAPLIVALTVVAIGFKEQGLVVVPLVLIALWTGAPGVRLSAALPTVGIALAYLAFRLAHRGQWAPFEQDVGLGYTMLSAQAAAARFGASPLGMYAYNAASTVSNVLFAEPTAGVFAITRAVVQHDAAPWHYLYFLSSTMLTGVIVWWAIGAVRLAVRHGWSAETRVVPALVVALAASGVLSFNYSRDRLGGMALVVYAMAAFFAVRAAMARASMAPRTRGVLAAVALLMLSGAWQIRVVHTLEYERKRAASNRREWITDLYERRIDAATRPVYLRLLETLAPQGGSARAPHQTNYPASVERILGPF